MTPFFLYPSLLSHTVYSKRAKKNSIKPCSIFYLSPMMSHPKHMPREGHLHLPILASVYCMHRLYNFQARFVKYFFPRGIEQFAKH